MPPTPPTPLTLKKELSDLSVKWQMVAMTLSPLSLGITTPLPLAITSEPPASEYSPHTSINTTLGETRRDNSCGESTCAATGQTAASKSTDSIPFMMNGRFI